jgi:hypothetical protein
MSDCSVERHLLAILCSLSNIAETDQTQQRASLVVDFGTLADFLSDVRFHGIK